MKPTVFAIIACVLLIGLTDLTLGCDCGCKPCGPGGTACKGCPERVALCEDLINTILTLQKKVRQCVCGEPTWML
ncbi:salivary glue protein Sgs-7 [Drosophila subpulchrella]|uniref:salivary glue protein Sgs-7 n=1 Tax=Drosophila subpulchrella TaxID=1486046 RepID=UPI0018A17123|nr:salivary glue protein Sgs-7 [Drosophila subpulchrella]